MSRATLGQILLYVLISVQFAAQSPIYRRQAPDFFSDNNCPQARIDECKKSSNMSCTSLKEALRTQYDISHGGLLMVTPHYVFSMFELFYSGILGGENAPTSTSINTTTSELNRLARNRCDALLNWTVKGNSDSCQWKFTCRFNSSYFPSFLVQAKLNEERSLVEVCKPPKVESSRFV